MKRSSIITLALIATISISLCASSGWARGLGVLGLMGGGGASQGVELLLGRFETDTMGWGGFSGAGEPLGTVEWISPYVGRWTNSTSAYRGIASSDFSITSGKTITVSFTPSNCQGGLKFYVSTDYGGSAASGSSIQTYTCGSSVSYSFTSGVTASTAILIFYSGSTDTTSGSDLSNISVTTD